jgi:hypothetical protein
MTIHRAPPTTVISGNGAGVGEWGAWMVGSPPLNYDDASILQVITDANDATYALCPFNPGESGVDLILSGYTFPDIGADQRIRGVRLRVRGHAQGVDATYDTDLECRLGTFAGGAQNVGMITYTPHDYPADPPVGRIGSFWTVDELGNEWTISHVNSLRTFHLTILNNPAKNAAGRLYLADTEIDVRNRPQITSLEPPHSTTISTRKPLLTYTVRMNDGDNLERSEARIFAGPGPHDPDVDVWRARSIQSDPVTWILVDESLDVGSYTAFVRVAKLFNGELWWSEWRSTTFEIALPADNGALAVWNRLGCGTYRAFIEPRGGVRPGVGPIAEILFDTLRWERVLDETASASVQASSAACTGLLAGVKSWRHELAIYRDVDGREDWGCEWGGPLIGPSSSDEISVTIPARDVTAWFDRRLFTRSFKLTQRDLAEAWNVYVAEATNQDSTPLIDATATDTGIEADREVRFTQGRRIADELRELARSGIDFTAICHTVHVGGRETTTRDLGVWRSAEIAKISWREQGLEAGNDVVVIGAGGGPQSSPIRATVRSQSDADADGLLSTAANESSIKDVASAQAAADTRLDMLLEPPLYVTVTLAPECETPIQELIPGSLVHLEPMPERVPIDLPADWRISKVTVDADRNGGETIAVELLPPGSGDE